MSIRRQAERRPPSVRRAMSVGRSRVDAEHRHCPPDGGHVRVSETGSINMALLTEGTRVSETGSINISLLTEGRNFSTTIRARC